ncbi:solute carrier family 13 member 5-like [Plakobranchus ocellatus]|uniref:Solute carrier family 13 member 5-like n=1 Tax=Plakobranchus ocellatus TaxID=259542 RepID=A0AAV4D0P6_9GAST|nr:solute carrier family 13 member 5-like [Plakobranchus ocellatus]
MALGRSRGFQQVCAWRNYIILLLTPILFIPVLLIGTSEAKCAYCVMVMAVYWFSEAIPVGITALLPVVLFPLLDVVKSSRISMLYMTDTNMMLFGSMLVAVSIEYWNIHKRIALRTLMIVGSEPRWLMLGLMLATWFLSMWISNMATAAMMIPITEAVLQQLEDYTHRDRSQSLCKTEAHNGHANGENGYGSVVLATESSTEADDSDNGTVETPLTEPEFASHLYVYQNGQKVHDLGEAVCVKITELQEAESPATKPTNFTGLCKGMSLCICYAANIGGVATLTGTGPNVVLKGNTDRLFDGVDLRNPISFGSWMAFALPLSLILLLICWIWLQVAFLGRSAFSRRSQDPTTSRRIKEMIADEYSQLGPLVFGQVVVLVLFIVLVVLWITRDVGGVAGWGRHFKSVSNSLPGILVGILMFVLPSTIPCLGSYDTDIHVDAAGKENYKSQLRVRPLMTWEYLNRKMPWQLVLLLGGGFAISEGFVASGLSVWIGDQLFFFRKWNEWLVLLVFCFITASATELASNNAICSVLLPIMEELAPRIGAHPLLFLIPVTLSCSFAFMLPVATPTNAIVFTYGRLRTIDMATAGFFLNIVAVPCTVLLTKTLGVAVFDLNHVPEEFIKNATSLVTP